MIRYFVNMLHSYCCYSSFDIINECTYIHIYICHYVTYISSPFSSGAISIALSPLSTIRSASLSLIVAAIIPIQPAVCYF